MSDVIKEFLVSIGYKVEEANERKFVQSIDNATKNVAKLGLAIEGALLALNAYALRVASSFDQIYYASGRVGASVTNIKSLSYGLSQMGTTAEAANTAIENFARTLRNSPGHDDVLKRLGVNVVDAKGIRRDTTALMEEFGKALRDKPQYLQALYLEMFGIDERTGQALIKGVEQFSNEYREKLKKAGLDPDKAAKDGNALTQTMRSIGSSIDIIGAKIASRLFDDQGNAFKRFLDFLDKHGDKIADTVSKLALVALQLAEAFLKLASSDEATKALNGFLGMIGKIDEKTGAFEADIDKLKIALEVFAGFIATTWVMKILGAFGLVGGGWGSLMRTLGIPIGIGLAASGGGHMTPEGYKETLASDPARAKADAELNAQGGSGKRWWKRTMPSWLGGDKDGEGEKSPEAAAKREKTSAASPPADSRAPIAGAVPSPLGAPPTNLLDNIARAEGTYRTGYNTSLAHGKFLPGGVEQELTSKSLREIQELGSYMRRQPGNPNSSALGRYQILGTSTMLAAAKALNMDLDQTKFDQATQDQMAHWIALKQGLGAWEGFKYHPRERAAAAEALAAGRIATPSARKPLTVNDILPGGLKGAVNGGLPSFQMPQAPAPSVDQSKQSTINIHQAPINVTGMNDGKQVADRIDRVQGYRTSDLVRNMRSSVG